MQLAPDRPLTVHHFATTDVSSHHLDVTLVGISYDPPSAAVAREIEIQIQEPDEETSGDLAWKNVDTASVNPTEVFSTSWRGVVTYPASISRARLLITETEKLRPDSKRVMYADIVPLGG
jgi:hypothetical protein